MWSLPALARINGSPHSDAKRKYQAAGIRVLGNLAVDPLPTVSHAIRKTQQTRRVGRGK